MRSNQLVVVYATDGNKEYREMILSSINSLRIRSRVPISIVNTGNPISLPTFTDPCDQVLLPPEFGTFPYDKCLIGFVKSENVIYIDADTFVLDDIERLYLECKADFSARPSWTYQNTDKWNSLYEQIWIQNLRSMGAEYVPVFNSGVLVFKNNLHKRIFTLWRDTIRDYLEGSLLPVYGGTRLFEQLALSMVVGKLGIEYDLLSSRHHAYAWNKELSRGTVVLHTTSKWYSKYSRQVQK